MDVDKSWIRTVKSHMYKQTEKDADKIKSLAFPRQKIIV
jgi:hypothetical protein